MSKDEFDGAPESEWEDRGDVAWNEFDWERYLRAQDETVNRYLAYYETFRNHPQRIDEVARHMDWENGEEATASAASPDEDADELPEDLGADSDVYTLRFAFTGELLNHDPTQSLDRPVIGTHWLSRDDLLVREPQLRTPLVLRCIDDFLAGRRLPLSAVPTITDAAVAAG